MSRAHRFQAFSRSIDFLNLMDAFMRDTMTTTPEKQQRKHAELIHAWADGATIEFKVREGVWATIRTPLWEDDVEYRLQPAPPAKVYPTTMMSSEELKAASKAVEECSGFDLTWIARSIANAAIKHAITNNQVKIVE